MLLDKTVSYFQTSVRLMFCNITLLLYLILIQLFLPTHLWFLLVISSHLSAPATEVTDERHPPRGTDLNQADM